MDADSANSALNKRYNPCDVFYGCFIPDWLMCREEVSDGAKLCFGKLAQYAGKNGFCFPFRSTLAKNLGTTERQIARYLSDLKTHKLIEVVRTGRSSNYYFLKHPWADENILDKSSNGSDGNSGQGVSNCLRDRQDAAYPVTCSIPDRTNTAYLNESKTSYHTSDRTKMSYHTPDKPKMSYRDRPNPSYHDRQDLSYHQNGGNPIPEPPKPPIFAPEYININILNKKQDLTTARDLSKVEGKKEAAEKYFEIEKQKTVNIAPLKKIGLTQEHLRQLLMQKNLTLEDIQNSIDYFAHDLQHNKTKKITTTPLNYFMGILRKGQAYSRPMGYKSPEDVMREKENEIKSLQEKAREKEREKTEKSEKKKKLEIFNTKFTAWMNSLTGAEIQTLLPPDVKHGTTLAKFYLRDIFIKQLERIENDAKIIH
jgi:hypothetical protein